MDLFDLYAKISLDDSDYIKSVNKSSESTENLANKLKSGLGKAAKIGAVAISAAATGIAALTKSSIENYGEYEQLVGGVETLFKSSSDTVVKYASNAYKTAGLSANDYMNTVTSFSASLLQSLGGDTNAAAKYANTAITDMSDNANKMGTSMDSIQNAYQGFAKQNYTMLDNLKLGYGGTKEEMQRLISDANKMNAAQGKTTNYTISSYADVVSAIHDVQTEMDITGTTQKEASTTIQGSLNSLKSAYTNLVTGMSDSNQDFGKLIDDLVSSATTAASNLLPVLTKSLTGIGKAVTSLTPVIETALGIIATDVLPSLINSAVGLISSMLKAVINIAPTIIDTLFGAALDIVDSLLDILPTIVESGMQIVISLMQGLTEALPTLIPAVANCILLIASTLTSPDMLPQIITSGINLILSLAQGLILAVPTLVSVIPQIIQNVVMTFMGLMPEIIPVALNMITTLAMGLISFIPSLIAYIPMIFSAIVGAFKKMDWKSIGISIVKGIIEGLESMIESLLDSVKSIGHAIINKFKEILGIHSPSKVFAGFGKMLDLGLAGGIGDNEDLVYGQLKDSFGFDGKNFGGVKSSGITQTINIYQPVSSPIATAMAIKKSQRTALAGGSV